MYLKHNAHLVGTQCQTDTTVSALSTFFLAMLANPEAQRKAQTEIDAVTGGKYLPDFDDEAAMPYVSALVKEVLRWKNVTPIGMYFIGIPSPSHNSATPGVPHFLATEDEYRGYRLPAGSIVIGSTWSVIQIPRFFSISKFSPPAGRFYTTKYFNLSVLISVLAQHNLSVAHVSRSIYLQTRAFLARREAQSRCEGSRLRGLRFWTEVRLTRTGLSFEFYH
jgi:hypothetical protein